MAKKKEKNDPSIPLKNPKHELFCWLFSGHHNRDLFGNGTQCYLHAYGGAKEIAQLQEEIADAGDEMEEGYRRSVDSKNARIKSLKNTASANSGDILRLAMVRARCSFLLREMSTDEFSDEELTYVIGQRKDLQSKVQAIKHRDTVRKRVSDSDSSTQKVQVEFSWEQPEARPVAKEKGKTLVSKK